MKIIPFKNHDITNPDLLFGRGKLLSVLYDHAERLDPLQLIGARRFGKTCLLKCLETKLKSDGEHNAYPIYLDLKSHGIKGTANVYKYLISVIISNLYSDGWINDSSISYSNIEIKPRKKWREVYNDIDSNSETILTDTFEKIVEYYSELLEQTFLLLFDEYEYMATSAFDRIDGFMLIREMSNLGNRPISFWLAGATPWKKYTEDNNNKTVGGSGEFNAITRAKYVRPLDFESFNLMWKHECDALIDNTIKDTIVSKVKEVYEATGGVPFYAKSLGCVLCVESKIPDYTALQEHFSELEKMLTANERKLLREIVKAPKTYQGPIPASITNLENYGLLTKDAKNRFAIPIKYYADYIKSILYDQQSMPKSESSIDQMVNMIEDLIYTINENWKRTHNVFMFDLSNDDRIQYKYLRTICVERGKFSNFINAIYLLHWEGAKDGRIGGAKLPLQFKNSTFRRAMDRLRHTFGNAHQTDKLMTLDNQISKGEALEFFTGFQAEPLSPSDWMQLQGSVLKNYIEELSKINRFISPRR